MKPTRELSGDRWDFESRPRPRGTPHPWRLADRLREISAEAWWLWAAVVLFVVVSAWWLTQDTRVPDFDSGIHLHTAFVYEQAIVHGNLLLPFTSYDSYPPLVHTLGALTILVAGMHPMALILSSNIVFVPLLAFGCYGVGKIVAGPRAGLLAGIFALGTPMFVSMMHLYDLDPPQAAMVAVSVWAVLASRRFESLNRSLVAGIVCGLALMTKETSAVFLAGLVLSIIARGGWRNWRGLIVFALVVFDVAGIWYVLHFSALSSTLTTIGGYHAVAAQTPARWSLANGAWYFWDLVNQQTLAPLAILAAIGIVIATLRLIRSSVARRSYLPDLLVGALVSYAGMTYLTHKDPRYTLPALVYLAVLATFWIPSVSRPALRAAASAAVVAFAAVNFFGMSFGIGGVASRVALTLPGAQGTLIYPGHLTLYEDSGWVRGGPEHNGDVLALLKGLRREGVRTISMDPSADVVDFSTAGILPLADAEHITVVLHPRKPTDRYLLLRAVHAGDPRPCQWIRSTLSGIEEPNGPRLGIYVLAGSIKGLNAAQLRNPADPSQRFTIACP